MKPRARGILLVLSALALTVASCGGGAPTRSTDELLPALLTVSEMPAELASQPVEWYENMRKEIDNPSPPWEDTLDPYLCPDAGTPTALTKPQVQLELTGGSIMEILLSSKGAEALYSELEDAYGKCDSPNDPAYVPLTGIDAVGDESASFRSDRGVVTIARFGNDIMILKWWVGDFYEQVAADYPDIVATAAAKVEDL